MKNRCVLTIAGSDCSGGAGIQADIKTISALGCYAASVITALTAQNTQGVQSIQELPSYFIRQQLNSIFNDMQVSAVKIGMLYTKENMDEIESTLTKFKPKHIVLDPVMVAKGGHTLLPSELNQHMKEKILPLANLMTPNIPEVHALFGIKIENETDMAFAAEHIGRLYNINLLIKGGHLNTELSSDVLYVKHEEKIYWFHEKRIHTKNTHGTGCTLSSAIATYLAQDNEIPLAISNAKSYLTSAIQSAVNSNLGQGHGPVDHFHHLR